MAESQNTEYKEVWKDDYLKWICGFANSQGGTLYIGVDDNGKVIGLTNEKKLLEDLPNKIASGLGIITEINSRRKNGLDYIEINVSKSIPPISYHGEFYVRSGATNQKLTGTALIDFISKKQVFIGKMGSLKELLSTILMRRALRFLEKKLFYKKE